jgi:capsular polysaccharide biosynthesis protein
MLIKKNIYPPPIILDISSETGGLEDCVPPLPEPIDIVFVPNSLVGCYGYITKKFKTIKKTMSPRHRDAVSFSSVFSSYFVKNKIKTDKIVLSIAHGWYDSFYHFTLECMVKVYLLREYINIENTVFIFPRNHFSHHKQWFEIVGLKNIIFLDTNEVIVTPLAISTNFPNRDLNYHEVILWEFRTWILEKIQNVKVINSKKIFVGRAINRIRNLKNQNELAEKLSAIGFDYVEMENYSIVEQINIFRNAEQIIAVHGASLALLTFCSKETKIIDLIHKDFMYQYCFLKLSKIMNLNYLMVPCEGDFAEKGKAGFADIYANINEIYSIIEKW